MATVKTKDLVIIGSGPGGYVAAVRAAQLGMKTAIVEKYDRLGGVCLNVGCIPSKALLDSSEYFLLAKERFAEYGVKTGRVSLDLATMMARKEKVVKDLTDSVRRLMEGNRIEVIHGSAELSDKKNTVFVKVKGKKAPLSLKATHILLATGSYPIQVPGLEFDKERIVSSTEALSFDAVPKHLGIVGGGYIGLELGSVWRRLGSRVTVIEMLPRIAAGLDGQVGRTLDRILKEQGFLFKMNTKVANATIVGKKVKAVLETNGNSENMTFDKLLVSVGRRPMTVGLGIEKQEIATDAGSGHILVDETFQTSVDGIYAIGDLIPGPMLAHKASAEGVAAVECMAGKSGEVNYDAIPSVVYTWPEVASVGLTEEQVKVRNIPFCVGSYPFSGTGRARCMGETKGFVKIIAQKQTDRILGVHIIGPRAADMIAECVLAMEFGASSEDIARTIHGHPTFSEALMEAATNVRKCSIYAS